MEFQQKSFTKPWTGIFSMQKFAKQFSFSHHTVIGFYFYVGNLIFGYLGVFCSLFISPTPEHYQSDRNALQVLSDGRKR